MLTECLLIFCVCTIIVMIISNSIFHAQSESGTLRIDLSNPDKDLYRIEIDNIDDLSRAKRIILKVDRNADLSQKKHTL